MYARDPAGQVLTFSVSGQLWKDSLVMFDAQTRSLWSHLRGEAMLGPLQGRRLERLPSVLADWRGWRERYPTTTVAWFPTRQPEFDAETFSQPNRFVLGIADGRLAKCWSLDGLRGAGCRNDTWAGRPVVAVVEPRSAAARLWERRVDGRELTFSAAGGELVDEQTGSVWDPLTGRALRGPMASKQLEALPAVVAFRDAWLAMYPRSERVP